MTQVMKGVRVLEVAQFTFVPAAGAILADWGADVIHAEHPVRGDTQRGRWDGSEKIAASFTHGCAPRRSRFRSR